MSTTEQRTGFRLPWSNDGRARDAEGDPEASASAETDVKDAAATEPAADPAAEEPTAEAAAAAAETDAAAAESTEPVEEMSWPEVDRRIRQSGRRAVDRGEGANDRRAAALAPRRVNPLRAELSKAMHAAAEAARAETLEGLAADANARIEAIRNGSADEAASIKQQAEADVAAVREWSKTELARIRGETERRIGERRSALEKEVAQHGARVEKHVERVRHAVTVFEAQMATFFERLLAEEDPTQVAFLAEQLPEAPSLEIDDELEDVFDSFDDPMIGDAEEAEPVVLVADAVATDVESVNGLTPETVPAGEAETATEAPSAAASETETVAVAAVDADEESATDAVAVDQAELTPEGAAAAEAESLAVLDTDGSSGDETAAEGADANDEAALSEAAIAARLAKMETADAAPAVPQKTELIVTGLVSVAGIAGFKRSISRLPGVTGVGVTSGPGGEFVYSVTHGPETDFKVAVSALPGFAARVTGDSEGVLRITATDHQADN